MTDDRWRDSYDSWKLASPYDEPPYAAEHLCQGCESDDGRYLHGDRWLCGDCLDDAERLAATDPDAPFDEADLREWSEEVRP